MALVVQMQSSLLLTKSHIDRELQDGIQEIMSAAERASDLTRQLLTFSRRKVKQAQELDIAHVIGDMLRLLRRLLGEDIELEERLAPSLPRGNT